MGKMFKGATGKIFSIALVLCMVASMLPATTASATNIGDSVTYDFTAPGEGVDLSTTTVDLSTITEESGYNWSYGGSKHSSYTAKVHKSGFVNISPSSKAARPKGVWYALKIDAPSVGVYSASLMYHQEKQQDDYVREGDVYLIPVGDVTDEMTIDDLLNEETKIYDGIKYSNTSAAGEDKTDFEEALTFDGSDDSYYLVFCKPLDEDVSATYTKSDGSSANVFTDHDTAGTVYSDYAHAQQYPISFTLTKTAEIEKKYTFTYDFNQSWTEGDSLTAKGYGNTKQSWEFADKSHEGVSVIASSTTRDYMYISTSSSGARTPGMWGALKLKTPVAGTYEAVLTHGRIKSDQGNTLGDIYWIPVNDVSGGIETALATDTYKKYDDVKYFNDDTTNNWTAKTDLGTFEVKEGNTEHYIVFRIPTETTETDTKYYQMFPSSLTLTAGTSLAYMGTNLTVSDELTAGDTSTVTATGYLSDGSEAEGEMVSKLTSDNTSVITVSDAVITAASAGKATISAEITYEGAVVDTVTKEITVKAPATESAVKVAIDDDGDGYATVTDATLGSDVVATATVPTGKVFRGWVRGSAENGRLVSTENPYTFKALTNIYLTAIYTDAPVEGATEYYNWNGEFLGTTVPEKEPTLLGYVFAKTWKDAGNDGEISRKIAEFNKEADEYNITADSSFTMEKEDSRYDTKVTCTSTDGAVYWYRDDKLVDYGTEYTFFIWDETTVTTSDEGNDGAKIMLDKAKSGSWMIEYDAGTVGKDNILEVGIVFGNTNSTPTVEVCEEKMSSQREISDHGQFAATSDYAVARGYLIYNDNGTYRVIYAD